ncbi:MAG: efflux RND transporter permease subunit [Stenotrophobium sp.]
MVDPIAFCTRRPVAVVMLTVAVLLFGMVSASRLRVTLLPDLSYPTLTVRTLLPGAAPTEVETLLSKPVEEALGIIKGVRQVRSVSRAGQSDVTLEFNWGTQMDYAVLDVREKLDALQLPKDAQRPIVLRFDPSQDPIVRLGMFLRHNGTQPVDEADLKRLRRLAEDQVQRPLEGVDGVAAVKISGGLEDEIHVAIDLKKMAQLKLTLQTVAERLSAENANISGGRVDQGSLSYLVRTLNQFTSLDQIRDTVIVSRDGQAIHLRDFASVTRGYKERQAIIRIDGEEAVEISLYKEGDGNTVSVANAALAKIDALRKTLPPDVQIKTLYNQAVFIDQSITEVGHAAIEGGLLAILIIYLFLRNAWTTTIVAVAIPVSVIATFNIMYGAKMSLNIMSLGGIALAIGLLVDDAIVVLESISRKREMGLAPLEAANRGAREVGAAVTASTLTTVAVFFPMVFVQGIAGQLFADQALVVTGALLFSLLVSFTLTPMMASRTPSSEPIRPAAPRSPAMYGWRRKLSSLRITLVESLPVTIMRGLVRACRALAWALGRVMRPLAARWQRGYAVLERRYVPLLAWALDHRLIVLAIAAALFGASLLLLTRIGVELIPPFNQGEFSAELTLPPGTPLADSDALLRQVAATLHGNPALAANYSIAGTGDRLDANADSGGENFGTLSLVLKPGAAAQQPRLMKQLDQRLRDVPGLSYRYTRPTLFTLKTPLEIEVYGYDLDALARVSEALRQSMVDSGRYTEIKTTQAPGHPEIQILFDQERAAALGLDTSDLADRVVREVQGDVATRYRLADREVDVRVRGDTADRNSVQAVRDLIVNPESARPVPLSAVADVRLRSGPSEIRRADQQRVVALSAGLARGDLGEAVADMQHRINRMQLPQGVSVQIAGQSEEMKVSFRSLQFALALAIFMVYLVMASQFESLVHPFVILFSIPLAAIGAIFALYITGSVINVIALIGMIMLVGIVVKNGIILIDLVNRLRDDGLSRRDAILKAGPTRLRPILMTTLTAVLGLVPMAIGSGEGAEVRAPMAITVIGGLTVSTLLTLLVIPVMYTLLDRRRDVTAA